MYQYDLLYAAEFNLNESGNVVNAQLTLNPSKKLLHRVVIFDVSNDHAGKLVNDQI